jgi:hypothetical protein
MNLRSRLARLETRVQTNPALVRPSPEAMQRAEVARQRLPDCTDPEEALSLIRGLPIEVYSALLRLVPDALLIAMHDTALQNYEGPRLNDNYTWEELRTLPVPELMRLHRENLAYVKKRQGRYR